MIRVVLDTNILISALLSAEGPPARIFVECMARNELRMCVSADMYAEYEEVLRRPRLRRGEHEIASALRSIRELGLWFKPTVRVHACADPNDNIFLECAQVAEAHYVVTGNIRHFPAVWGATQILTARQFVDSVMEW